LSNIWELLYCLLVSSSFSNHRCSAGAGRGGGGFTQFLQPIVFANICVLCFAGGSSAVQTFDELVPAYRANLRSGPYYDEGDALTYTQLLGKGKAAFGYERDGIVTQFLQYSTCMQQQEWLGDDQASLVQLQLDMFSLAFKRGDEILWS